ncbi:MAG: geranylgeranylglycerol-phosphate geranylgeranyltransferase [Chitinophagales bacterium]|nr:geranylgeranylglycerol-phosphate geranylgeranyltransferase [Chitinophagales bacterium]
MHKIIAFFKLIRWLNLLVAGGSLLLFQYFIIVPVIGIAPTLSHLQVWLLALSVMLIMAGGNVINDFLDLSQDEKYKPQNVILGKAISINFAPYLIVFLNVLGVGIGLWLAYSVGNLKLANVFLISVLLLWQYSVTLKKYALVGNAIVAGLCALVFLLPVLFEVQLVEKHIAPEAKYFILTQMKGYALFAFVITLVREIVKDLEDAEADIVYKYHTLPVWLGTRTSSIIAGVIQLILMIGIGVVMYVYWQTGLKNNFWYAMLFLQFPLLINLFPLFVARNKTDYRVQSVMLKVIMVFGVATIPVFYLFSKL